MCCLQLLSKKIERFNLNCRQVYVNGTDKHNSKQTYQNASSLNVCLFVSLVFELS